MEKDIEGEESTSSAFLKRSKEKEQEVCALLKKTPQAKGRGRGGPKRQRGDGRNLQGGEGGKGNIWTRSGLRRKRTFLKPSSGRGVKTA